MERERRAYLNRVGRIVEGQILEIARARVPAKLHAPVAKPSGLFQEAHLAASSNGAQKLLHYTYSISGVTYETARTSPASNCVPI